MPCTDAVFEYASFLSERHGLEFDVRDTGAGASPNARMLIGQKLLHMVVGQVAFAGQELPPIARLRRKVQP
jgi:hypothetical protein